VFLAKLRWYHDLSNERIFGKEDWIDMENVWEEEKKRGAKDKKKKEEG
jgi:hypothetical protein